MWLKLCLSHFILLSIHSSPDQEQKSSWGVTQLEKSSPSWLLFCKSSTVLFSDISLIYFWAICLILATRGISTVTVFPHYENKVDFFLICQCNVLILKSADLMFRLFWSDTWCRSCETLLRHGFLHICVALTQADWRCELLPGTTTHEKLHPQLSMMSVWHLCPCTQRHLSQRTCILYASGSSLRNGMFKPPPPPPPTCFYYQVKMRRLQCHNLKINFIEFPHFLFSFLSAALIYILICLFLTMEFDLMIMHSHQLDKTYTLRYQHSKNIHLL